MAIVATEIESIHGAADGSRLIYYRCQDSQGEWHRYGPIITTNANFDAVAYKTTVAEKVAEQLAAQEANDLIGGL